MIDDNFNTDLVKALTGEGYEEVPQDKEPTDVIDSGVSQDEEKVSAKALKKLIIKKRPMKEEV